MTRMSVLATPCATTSLIPDLPCPRPRTIMIMVTTLVTKDLDSIAFYILVGITVRACAPEMASPPRE